MRDGTLSFERKGDRAINDPLVPGEYTVPFQGVSMILLGPGSTVSHDALRLLARHGTGTGGSRHGRGSPLHCAAAHHGPFGPCAKASAGVGLMRDVASTLPDGCTRGD